MNIDDIIKEEKYLEERLLKLRTIKHIDKKVESISNSPVCLIRFLDNSDSPVTELLFDVNNDSKQLIDIKNLIIKDLRETYNEVMEGLSSNEKGN